MKMMMLFIVTSMFTRAFARLDIYMYYILLDYRYNFVVAFYIIIIIFYWLIVFYFDSTWRDSILIN